MGREAAELGGAVLVGARTAGSRVVFGPHVTNLGRRRAFSERHVAYYARRAAGGAGVIVTEVASVHDSDRPYERAPLAVDAVEGWAAVVRACRPHGALVLAGLGHAGGQGSSAYHQQALWAPSRVPDPVSREVPMGMEAPDVDALVAGFGAAARLAVEADLDGVEIAAGQHSLLRQFLSGLTNHRADAHRDGSLLLRAVLDAVRTALGEGRVLGLRLCCDELAPWAGITPDGIAPVVAALDVDYLVPVRGSALSVGATRPDLHTEPGVNVPLCSRLRTGSLTVLQGSVVDPAMAQAALDDGTADLVEMTRAQITDPDLVAHVRAGTPERIRPCTLSGRRTAVRGPRNALVSDDAEPGAGYETVDPPLDGRDPDRRDVLVVGGGPAGLEAARTLALRGHRVRLAEREPVLGGALRWAAALPGRSRFGLLIPWWERELARLGVRVTTGVEIGVDDLAGDVVLATGSRAAPHRPSDVPVLDAAELLAGSELPPGPVLVDDPVGDAVGVGIAELLAAAGRVTSLVTPDPVAGSGLTVGLAAANARLDRAGVRRELLTRLRGVQDGWASLEHVWTGVRRRVPCAAVIDCGHRLPEDTLWRARPDLPRAGDCVAPRTLSEAVLEGRRAAAPPAPVRGKSCPGTTYRARVAQRQRRLVLRNRIVFAAHLTNFAVDGLPTDQHVAYYAARAAGGAGLVIVEEQGCDPDDRAYEKTIDGTDPRVVPGYRAITDAVHAHGAAVLAQLTHSGGQASGLYTRRPVYAPSPVPDPLFREVPVELDAAGIARIVAGYARTAAHCVAGGFDGVELQGAHSSLIRQFLSPATNHRRDGYGTDRSRFLREVVAAVRDAIGPAPVVGVRLCGDEGIEHGIGIDDAVAVARELAATGQVDLLGTAIGVATSTLHLVTPSMRVAPGYAQSIPAALKRAVDLPVIGIGRFTTVADAQAALASGACDLVGAVRGQIAEPSFASAPVRACVGCNQECVGRVGQNRWIGCAINPRAGREAVPLPAPGPRRRVLVVGGGPAGLRAAATAAARGHRVLLCERDGETGGAVRLAAAAPGRAEFGNVVRDLLGECAGVEIRTGTEVDAAFVSAEAPDVVVLATGARPRLPDWVHRTRNSVASNPQLAGGGLAGAGAGRVVDVREVLAGRVAPAGRVLVVDELGFHQAPAVAELLAARGCAVEIVTPALVVAQDLGTTLDLELFHRRAHVAGLTLTTDRLVTGFDGREATVLHHTTGRMERRAVDWVVCAVPPEPEDGLWHQLRDGPRPVHRIGDCLAPRRVHAAIVEGHRVAVAL